MKGKLNMCYQDCVFPLNYHKEKQKDSLTSNIVLMVHAFITTQKEKLLEVSVKQPTEYNRYVGFNLGRGRKIEDILNEMAEVAEEVKTVKVVMELAEEYKIEMPIASEVYKVLYEGGTVQRAFRGLLRRDVGSEAEPG